ncbi:MAG: hypothetical protein ACFFDQ_06845, partial [Candidatus Thorarchaeota archaeon]
MAFDDGLGLEPSDSYPESYSVSATGLISNTFSLWARKLGQYIIIVGIPGIALTVLSFLFLMILFNAIGVITTNPITYFFDLFTYTTLPELSIITMSLVFATVAFIINAVVTGAAIKFALDDYAGSKSEIGSSFSHASSKTWKIIVVQILLAIIVSAAITPSLILTGIAMESVDISDPFNPIFPPGSIELILAAFVLLIVGGIVALYISARFAPTLAIVVNTDMSAIDSLKNSWELTSGNVLHVLAGQILLGISVIVLNAMTGFGLG